METVSVTPNQPTLRCRQWEAAPAMICNQNITIIVKSDRRSAVWHTEWLISAGTRTRSLWIRSPARYSIAPQRLRQNISALSRFRYLISSRIAVPCIPAASGPVWADILVVPASATRGRCCRVYIHIWARSCVKLTGVQPEVHSECLENKSRHDWRRRCGMYSRARAFILKARYWELCFCWSHLYARPVTRHHGAKMVPVWALCSPFHIIIYAAVHPRFMTKAE